MVHVTGLDHIVLNVADVERSIAFYAGCLGLRAERVEAWRRGEIRFPSVRIDEATIIDLFASPSAPGEGRENLAHFCLVTDAEELEPVLRELRDAGVPIDQETVVRWGARGDAWSIYFRDPDGNQIELRTYAQSVAADA